MSPIEIVRVMRRWQWVIVAVTLVTLLGVGVKLMTTKPLYAGVTKLQVTAPDDQDVVLFDQYGSTNRQDAILVARSNFTELLQSREVTQRTIEQLGLKGNDANYVLTAENVRDADYIAVSARTNTPELSAKIANAQVAVALAYYGEVRAKAATVAKQFLRQQLNGADATLTSVEKEFSTFKVANNITVMEDDLASERRLIDQLQLQRDQQTIAGPTTPSFEALQQVMNDLKQASAGTTDPAAKARFNALINSYQNTLASLRRDTEMQVSIDKLIAQHRQSLMSLIALQPRYNEFQARSEQARRSYQLLQDKFSEAELKENTVKTVSFIQVIEPALVPDTPVATNSRVVLGLALLGGLGLGIVLAFALEALQRRMPRASSQVATAAGNGD